MKNAQYIFLLIIYVFVQSCNKGVPIYTDFDDAAGYSKIYMPLAENNPQIKGVNISDIPDTVFCSAYVGGLNSPANDLTVKFMVDPAKVDVYNQMNGTDYQLMPEGSFDILSPEATIAAGARTTGTVPIVLKSKGFIDPFETYLLPVTISYDGPDANVNTSLSTVYYLLTGSYAPGEVPREHVLKLENGSLQAFAFGTGENAALVVRHTDNDMYRYPLNADGTFASPDRIGIGWGNVNIFISYGDRWLVRTDDGGIWQYLWTQDGTYISSNQVGWGWEGFDIIIGFNGYVMNRSSVDGAFTRWPYVDCFCGGVFPVNGNWTTFTQIIPYKNTLLGITTDGKLIEQQMTAEATFISSREIGSGWDIYTKVIPFGDDLLAMDSNGDVWRYKFDPRGNWVLKK
jgi:hypothetical protein